MTRWAKPAFYENRNKTGNRYLGLWSACECGTQLYEKFLYTDKIASARMQEVPRVFAQQVTYRPICPTSHMSMVRPSLGTRLSVRPVKRVMLAWTSLHKTKWETSTIRLLSFPNQNHSAVFVPQLYVNMNSCNPSQDRTNDRHLDTEIKGSTRFRKPRVLIMSSWEFMGFRTPAVDQSYCYNYDLLISAIFELIVRRS